MIGMLWFDNSESGLAGKVARAAEYYREKYGEQPNLCCIHPSLAPQDGRIDGIEVRGTRAVMPNHFLIGVERETAGSGS